MIPYHNSLSRMNKLHAPTVAGKCQKALKPPRWTILHTQSPESERPLGNRAGQRAAKVLVGAGAAEVLLATAPPRAASTATALPGTLFKENF